MLFTINHKVALKPCCCRLGFIKNTAVSNKQEWKYKNLQQRTDQPTERSPEMGQFIKSNPIWRLFILALLIAAIAGPWTYDLVNVPSEFPCSEPFIRLQGDYCGVPLSGSYTLLAVVLESANKVGELFTGTADIKNTSQWFLIVMGTAFLLLPLFSTLALILRKNQNHHRITHLVVWSLAAISILSWSLILPDEWHLSPLWGYWLYVGLAACMLILEAVLASKKKFSQPGLFANH